MFNARQHPRIPALRRLRRALPILPAALALAACSDGAPGAGAAAAPPAPDSLQAPWTTLIEQTMEGRALAPAAFRASADTLRVITTMGAAITPLSRGVVVTNLLSGDTQIPLASVYAEPLRADSASVDTSLVAVEPGELYLYVAQHRGLRDWRVVVQEQRR